MEASTAAIALSYGQQYIDSRMATSFDVLIIGNGALPLSTAVALLRREPQLRLALVGPRERPGGASLVAGAMTRTFAEVTDGGLNHVGGRLKHALAVEALRSWPQWLTRLAQRSERIREIGAHLRTLIEVHGG